MQPLRRASVLLVRACVVAASVGAVWLLEGLPTSAWAVNLALGALAVPLLMTALVSRRRLLERPMTITLVTADLLIVAGLGCVLVAQQGGVDSRLPFLAAFLIANLVAMVGHTLTSGVLGGLAGTMVLGVSTAWFARESNVPAIEMGFAQALLVMSMAMETAFVARGRFGQAQRHRMASLVAQQVATRETEAEELSDFMHRLVEVATTNELAEVVLEHLRTHYPIRAHAVALGASETALAVWQEDAALDPHEIESRRMRLQKSLARVGSEAGVPAMRFRSLGHARVKTPREPRTFVEIPIQLSGNVVGVVLLADPNPGAVAAHRIGMLTEIARRTAEAWHRIERQQERQTRQTTLILREMRDGILLLDANGQVLIANPAARRTLAAVAQHEPGRTARRLGTTSLEELGSLPPGITRRFRCHLAAQGSEEPRHLACTAVSVVDDGRRVGTLVTLSDVTEEDRSRQRLIQSEKMNLVGQTLAGVAHELNNPLAALMGYADLLRNQKVPDEAKRSIAQMREQAVRAIRIVKNLLNFARRRSPERRPTNVKDLIEETLELFVYEARIANVTVVVEIEDMVPPILADRHAIQQIVVNLVQNALHAMEHLGPKSERRMTVTATAADGMARITVSDTGNGVPDDLRPRIFEPFFTTKGTKKGTGLGLALSRSIAQDHGGELLLESQRDTPGARFVIQVPLYEPESMVVTEDDEPERVVVPHRVLVVDDEQTICETVKGQLARFGARVDSAFSTDEALDLIPEGAYDVVLVDLRMPGSSGLDLHRQMTMRHPKLAQRTVFMTGDFVNDDLLQSVHNTGLPLLEKPFTEEELTKTLGRASAGPQAVAPKEATTKVHVPTFTTTTS